MENSMEHISKSCSSELAAYHRCLLANPSSPAACDAAKADLNGCAARAVPILGAVKSQCAKEIAQFDACLKEHEGIMNGEGEVVKREGWSPEKREAEMQKRCGGVFAGLWKCTERVRESMESVN